MPGSGNFLSAMAYSKAQLGMVKYQLKEKQIEALEACYDLRDCIAILPTGYGKSLIYQLLPYLMQCRYEKSEPMVVIVVSPLNAIMQDQVAGLADRGINACFLDNKGTSGTTYELASCERNSRDEGSDDNDDGATAEVSVYTEIKVTLSSLQKGEYKLIYAHPETLISNTLIGKMLRSKTYRDLVACIVVDEVHLVTEWGEKFRTDFSKLADLNSLFGDSCHLVLTATLAPQALSKLIDNLQLKDPKIVKTNPDRQNIFIEKKKRLSNIDKFSKYDDLIEPLCKELNEQKSDFPVTIVYVDGLDCLGYCFQYLTSHMSPNGYLPNTEQVPENRIFAQYHKGYTKRMKSMIIYDLKKSNPIIRLVLATIALGMGLDAPSVSRVIHFRPPTSMEKYAQEIGRAGRNGMQAEAILYYNMSDIAANRPGITSEIRDFCLNNSSCLREQLLNYFGAEKHFEGPKSLCCSNCFEKEKDKH